MASFWVANFFFSASFFFWVLVSLKFYWNLKSSTSCFTGYWVGFLYRGMALLIFLPNSFWNAALALSMALYCFFIGLFINCCFFFCFYFSRKRVENVIIYGCEYIFLKELYIFVMCFCRGVAAEFWCSIFVWSVAIF